MPGPGPKKDRLNFVSIEDDVTVKGKTYPGGLDAYCSAERCVMTFGPNINYLSFISFKRKKPPSKYYPSVYDTHTWNGASWQIPKPLTEAEKKERAARNAAIAAERKKKQEEADKLAKQPVKPNKYNLSVAAVVKLCRLPTKFSYKLMSNCIESKIMEKEKNILKKVRRSFYTYHLKGRMTYKAKVFTEADIQAYINEFLKEAAALV